MKLLHRIIFFALLNFFVTISLVFVFKDTNILAKSSPKKTVVPSSVVLPSQTPSPSPITLPVKTTSPVQETTVTSTPVPTVAVADNPNNSLCIITVDGQRYDVTRFRTIHSGGDIFNCGADMTGDFYSRHDSSFLSKMSVYKLP